MTHPLLSERRMRRRARGRALNRHGELHGNVELEIPVAVGGGVCGARTDRERTREDDGGCERSAKSIKASSRQPTTLDASLATWSQALLQGAVTEKLRYRSTDDARGQRETNSEKQNPTRMTPGGAADLRRCGRCHSRPPSSSKTMEMAVLSKPHGVVTDR
jgi:hypothetical protein